MTESALPIRLGEGVKEERSPEKPEALATDHREMSQWDREMEERDRHHPPNDETLQEAHLQTAHPEHDHDLGWDQGGSEYYIG